MELLLLKGGMASPLLLAPSLHAALQTVGGLLCLMWAFLAHGVPGMLGLPSAHARVVDAARSAVSAALVCEVLLGLSTPATALRVPLAIACCATEATAAAVAAAALSVLPAGHTAARRTGIRWPLAAALAAAPVALLLRALEAAGMAPAGIGSDLLLYAAVAGVMLAMGYQMLSAMLQLDAARRRPFLLGIALWFGGAVLQSGGRAVPVLLWPAAPALLAGAALWLVALRGLRAKRTPLILAATAGAELRIAVMTGVILLLAALLLNCAAAWTGDARTADLARHGVAIGFLGCMTVGITLRALPRFCGGRTPPVSATLVPVALLAASVCFRALLHVPAATPFASVVSGTAGALGFTLWAAALWRYTLRTSPP